MWLASISHSQDKKDTPGYCSNRQGLHCRFHAVVSPRARPENLGKLECGGANELSVAISHQAVLAALAVLVTEGTMAASFGTASVDIPFHDPAVSKDAAILPSVTLGRGHLGCSCILSNLTPKTWYANVSQAVQRTETHLPIY